MPYGPDMMYSLADDVISTAVARSGLYPMGSSARREVKSGWGPKLSEGLAVKTGWGPASGPNRQAKTGWSGPM